MEYKGKLYGKFGKDRYVPLLMTSEDVDALQERVKELESRLQSSSHTGTAPENDMTAEEFFNDPGGMFTLDFLSEEERQTIYKAIDLFVKGKLRMADRTAPLAAGKEVEELAHKLGNAIPTDADIHWAKEEIKKYEANASPLPVNREGWIRVEDGLPDIHQVAKYSNRVLCLTNTGKIEVGYLSDGIWARDNGHYFSGHGYTITHWQPLPSPPKTDKI